MFNLLPELICKIKTKGEVFTPKKGFIISLLLVNLMVLSASFGNLNNRTDPPGSFASSPVTSFSRQFQTLKPLSDDKGGKEVFGFAPFWTINKLSNVDFETLTTLAYFGVSVKADGNLDRTDQGYVTFKSQQATNLFKKAHASRTKVVLTLTQMNNGIIIAFLDNPQAQERLIEQAVFEVEGRGIDGINVDFEYDGNPGPVYRQKFTKFVGKLTEAMHQKNPDSKVTVSVYAASVKDPKIYDIKALSDVSDGIFMMAYDFATTSSKTAIPTAPLYGYKEGKYWYDVSSAVDDFLKVMPADKLILGVPWYGYNYPVYEPKEKSTTIPYYSLQNMPTAQTYSIAVDNIRPDMPSILEFKEGWDDMGKVGWKAYYRADTGIWRMLFLDDPKSLGLKYDFVNEKNLAGVGIWALGFDDNKDEMWQVLREKFGQKLADQSVLKEEQNEKI